MNTLLRYDSPDVDESLYGYLCRLARLNRYPSLRWIVEIAGQEIPYQMGPPLIKRLYEDGQFLGRLAAVSRQPYELVASLAYRPISGRNTHVRTFAAAAVPMSCIDVGHIRICPECIQADGIHRKLWELPFYTACHDHEIALVSGCSKCGASLRIEQDHAARCPHCLHGYSITVRSASTEAIQLANDIAVLAAGRRLPESGRPYGTLAELLDCVRALFSALAPSTWRRGRSLIEQLRGLPPYLDVAALLWPFIESKSSFERELSVFRRSRAQLFPHLMADGLMTPFKREFGGDGAGGSAEALRGWYQNARPVASVGIDARYQQLAEQDILSTEAAAQALGLRTAGFLSLQSGNRISAVGSSSGKETIGFRLSELNDFVGRLSRLAVAERSAEELFVFDCLATPDASPRVTSVVKAMEAGLNGKMPIYRAASAVGRGVAQFGVSIEDWAKSDIEGHQRRHICLSFSRAAAKLKVPVAALRALVVQGALKALPTQDYRDVILNSDLEEFRSKYVSYGEIAKRSRLHGRIAAQKLASLGIKPSILASAGAWSAKFYERSALHRLLPEVAEHLAVEASGLEDGGPLYCSTGVKSALSGISMAQ